MRPSTAALAIVPVVILRGVLARARAAVYS